MGRVANGSSKHPGPGREDGAGKCKQKPAGRVNTVIRFERNNDISADRSIVCLVSNEPSN